MCIRISAASVAISVVFTIPVLAESVTMTDLSGKSICWDNGHFGKSTFMSNGKYTDTIKSGTWTITANGVEIKSTQGNYVLLVNKLPDGTLTAFKAPPAGGPNGMSASGRYCK